MLELHPKYLTDDDGKKVAVMLPIEEYEELLEDVQDLAVMAERREDLLLSHEEVLTHLKENGYL